MLLLLLRTLSLSLSTHSLLAGKFLLCLQVPTFDVSE